MPNSSPSLIHKKLGMLASCSTWPQPLKTLQSASPLHHTCVQGRQCPLSLKQETAPTSLFFLFLFWNANNNSETEIGVQPEDLKAKQPATDSYLTLSLNCQHRQNCFWKFLLHGKVCWILWACGLKVGFPHGTEELWMTVQALRCLCQFLSFRNCLFI